jgi:pyruvate kinase
VIPYDNKGVNIPGKVIDLPAMSEKDKIDIRFTIRIGDYIPFISNFTFFRWGVDNNIDFIAASFVRKAADVIAIRNYATELIKEKHNGIVQTLLCDGPSVPLIVSKIESTEALQNFDSILSVSDAIMVRDH